MLSFIINEPSKKQLSCTHRRAAARARRALSAAAIALVAALALQAALPPSAAPGMAHADALGPAAPVVAMAYGALMFSVSGTEAVLTLPQAFAADRISLPSVVVVCDETQYAIVRKSFGNDTEAYIDGDPVALTIVFTNLAGDDTATEHTAVFAVYARRTPRIPATFAGDVAKATTTAAPAAFDAADFTSKYAANDDGDITGITIAVTEPQGAVVAGSLMLGGAEYALGSPIAIGDVASLLFVPKAAGGATFTAYAHNADIASDPARVGGVKVTVTVMPAAPTPTPTPPAVASLNEIVYTTSRGSDVALVADDFIYALSEKTSARLEYVTFSQTSSSGARLYYNYQPSNASFDHAVSAGDRYYPSSAPRISNISFVPKDDYVGTIWLNYLAYGDNGGSYNGSICFNFDEYYSGYTSSDNTGTYTNTVSYSTESRSTVWMSSSDFSSALTNTTGRTLSYVRFTQPSSDVGQMYYNYGRSGGNIVASDDRYYRGTTPDISNVAFVPNQGFTGLAVIPFTSYATNGSSYGGTLYVRVGLKSSDSVLNLSYRTNAGVPLKLSSDDFNSEMLRASGYPLAYVTFAQASIDTSLGRLYLGYRSATSYDSGISQYTRYYRSNTTPSISNVSFVPAAGKTGTASISFTAYASNSLSFSGKLEINIGTGGAGAGSGSSGATRSLAGISYEIVEGEALEFGATDVAGDILAALRDADADSLDYVTFTLPSSRDGRLMHTLGARAGGRQERAAEGAQYRDKPASQATGAEPSLAALSFVPASGFTGSVRITYMAYTDDGAAYRGRITITALALPTGWARDEIASLAARGIVPSELLGRYEEPITRAEFTAALVNAVDAKRGYANEESRSAAFTDISGSKYESQIERGFAIGIIDGMSAAVFEPDSLLTREQAAKILCTSVKLDPYSPGGEGDGAAAHAERFVDVDGMSGWARPYVGSAADNGLILGDEAGRFNPMDSLSREEALALVERAVEKFIKP